MYFKKLIGKKCYLSPIDINDAEKFTEWLNDLELTINIGPMYSSNINVESEAELLGKISKDHNYSIIDMKKNELIGNCGFLEVDNLNQTGEVGIFIGNKKFWNKGYGTEALMLLMDYGFKALNLNNIFLRVFEYNKRAIKCYEKIGFKHIGIRRNAIYRNMERHNMIYMDILENEYYKK